MGGDELWLVSFVSTELTWAEHNLRATLVVRGPGDAAAGETPSATLTIAAAVRGAPFAAAAPRVLTRMHVRVPRWARNAAAANTARSPGGDGHGGLTASQTLYDRLVRPPLNLRPHLMRSLHRTVASRHLRRARAQFERAEATPQVEASDEQRVAVDPNADFWSFALSQRALQVLRPHPLAPATPPLACSPP